MDIAEKIYEAVKPLPEPLAQEILHYIEFLRTRLERQEELAGVGRVRRADYRTGEEGRNGLAHRNPTSSRPCRP